MSCAKVARGVGQNVAGYAGHDASGVMLVEQEQGEDEGEREERTAYLGCGRSGFQDLVAAQTQLAMVLRLNFAPTGLFHDYNLLDVTVSWQRIPI